MKKIAIMLMGLTIFSKILGFFREITLSYFYGASSVSDAYLIALTIPGTIFAFIGTGIATSYIPMYNSIEQENSSNLANRFTSNIINFIMIICTLIILAVIVFTNPIVKLFASGFEGETLDMAIRFTRISVLGIYFTGLAYVFTPYLQVKNNFVIPALIGIPFNFFIVLSIIISFKFNITLLAIGNVIALASQLLLLIPFMYKKGYRHKIILDRHDRYLKKFIFLSLPVIIGVSVNQINILVDRTIASQIELGGISALHYANKLNIFIQGIFVTSIATAMYPTISRMASEHNVDGFKKTISEAVNGINLLVVPATVGTMIFAEPIVSLLFGRGAFDTHAISMTATALFFYALGMVSFGLREILSRAFYSLQDTKTPMINAAIALIINIVLNIILSKVIGIAGLALATSISAIFCTVLLFINLGKKIGPFGIKNIITSFTKILISSSIMGVVAKVTYSSLTKIMTGELSLVFSMGVGILMYFIIIYFMKIEDVDNIISTFKRKILKNN